MGCQRAVNMIDEITGMLNNIQYRKLNTKNMGELEEVHDIVSQLDKRTRGQ
ncbi:hypothetical protein KAU43_06300 [candidate division WOR-3 bacterium]|nr:hypothetical protein [candidate division WOR-3 bacterium]